MRFGEKRPRERVEWIDSAKGIAILLVVIGHVVGGYTGSYGIPRYQEFIDYIVWIIYTFHMPLFFCLSGYVYRISINRISNRTGYQNFIKKKTRVLMVPYYIFSTIQILIKLPLQGKISSVLSWKNILLLPVYAVDQYWFLYTLFLCFILIAYLDWKADSWKLTACLAIGMWVVTSLINGFGTDFVLECFQIPLRVGGFFVFFCFGARLCDLKCRFTGIQVIISGMIFLLLQWVVYCNDIESGIGVSVMRACLALTATITVFYLANKKVVRRIKWLRYVGKNSMSIYVVHVVLCAAIRILLYKAGIMNFAIHLFFGIVLSIVIPLLLQHMLSVLQQRIRKG